MMREVLKVLREKRGAARLAPHEDWSVVYDNASIHKNFPAIIAGHAVWHPIAPHSPDCNKPIEHVWGQMEAAKGAWVQQQQEQEPSVRVTAAAFRQAVQEMFFSISRESIAADVATLPATYDAVVAAGGGYPPAALM